ncbi:hypothetical protein H0H81_006098 [Sphagnurus paluster]|uniref:DUF3533 domain-containing protein n=1 Tax=Sphagnurus paluster TaxID=117069 RepID=A0A9P7KJ08_9AGAR|nr:hypothetical protein H0H81_006098 [Sphagnurus paluster]
MSHLLESPSPNQYERPFSKRFLDKESKAARKIYLKVLISGCLLVIISIWAIFPIYWGALWKTPERNFDGWVVDFDGGIVGQTVVRDLKAASSLSVVTYTVVPAGQFPEGPPSLAHSVIEQHTWVAVAINPGVSQRLQASYESPNITYNGSEVITVYAAEARNENA